MRFRNGQWVVHNGQIAIHVQVNPDGLSEVHHVDKAGLTTDIFKAVHPMELREAIVDEIPAPRRPTVQRAAELKIPATVESAKVGNVILQPPTPKKGLFALFGFNKG